ncbi:hypothetical protein EDD73_13713 [Heliophilum fasciatum]|uniref:Uncharacterized protein n=1 Tax=Heliophilum fasciatum TaxID=35700 RepID=A0A4R2RCC3_9FIRM|nr:hypothetical protein [Heliophilum fasciatum]TCP60453.1 hypothetical protein EDD73_13713 [Heliophilum fasciatum]
MGILIHYLDLLNEMEEEVAEIVNAPESEPTEMLRYLKWLEKRYALLLRWREVGHERRAVKCTG